MQSRGSIRREAGQPAVERGQPGALSCYARAGPEWRNGRRSRLKIGRPRGRQGSNPCFGTIESRTTKEAGDLADLSVHRLDRRPDVTLSLG